MVDKCRTLGQRLLHISLSQKVIGMNLTIVALMAVAGTVIAVSHVRSHPADPHHDLIALFVAVGLGITFVTNLTMMKLVLIPLDRLQAAVDSVRQGKPCAPVSAGPVSDERFDRLVAAFNQMLNVLEQNTQQLHRLSQEVLQAQEEERQRIARELHDEAAQTLTTVLVYLKLLEKSQDPEETLRIQNLRILTVHALEEVRQVALELRPKILDDWGLAAALGWRVDVLNNAHSVRTTLQVTGIEGRLPGALELVFYRVAQEALNNVARHAHAQHAHVVLKREGDRLMLQVQDDGVGFDVAAVLAGRSRGLGLLGMRERLALVGGELEIESQPGKGIRLLARAPLTPPILNGVHYGQDSRVAG